MQNGGRRGTWRNALNSEQTFKMFDFLDLLWIWYAYSMARCVWKWSCHCPMPPGTINISSPCSIWGKKYLLRPEITKISTDLFNAKSALSIVEISQVLPKHRSRMHELCFYWLHQIQPNCFKPTVHFHDNTPSNALNNSSQILISSNLSRFCISIRFYMKYKYYFFV